MYSKIRYSWYALRFDSTARVRTDFEYFSEKSTGRMSPGSAKIFVLRYDSMRFVLVMCRLELLMLTDYDGIYSKAYGS